MSVIDRLIAAGRDPLEAVLVPPADDVARWLADDRKSRLDRKIARELSGWEPEMRDRLRELARGSLTQRAADECQGHAWNAAHSAHKFCPDCGNPLSTHR